MHVVVVSRTQMHKSLCVGALGLDGRHVRLRLLEANGDNPRHTAEYQIGQVWDIFYRPHTRCTPPHVEDVKVQQRRYVRDHEDVRGFIEQYAEIWQAGRESIYGGCVRLTISGSGFISEKNGLPDRSTGFWRIDRPLTRLIDDQGKVRYQYKRPGDMMLVPYAGFEEHIATIPAKTLVRLSLARWWRPKDVEGELEERCYVQLSGWYV